MRRAPWAWFVAVLATVAAPSTVLAGDAPGPELTLGQEVVVYGDQLQVRGTGFPAGALAHIELCGNAALDATADCDVRGATEYAVRESGELFGVVQVRPLPQPCPCVVRVTLSGGGREVTAPIQVPDAGFVTAAERISPAGVAGGLEITGLRVTGGGGLGALVGAGQDRTAHVELTNSGSTTVRAPALAVTYGRGDDPTGILPVPAIQDIGPGSTVAVAIPVSVDALSFGSYTVRASVDGPGEPVVARTSIRTYPWALIAAVLVVVQLMLLRLRNRVRRRIATRVSSDDGGPPPPGEDAAHVDAAELIDAESIDVVTGDPEDDPSTVSALDARDPAVEPVASTHPDPFEALELAISSLMAASGTTAPGPNLDAASDLASAVSMAAADQVGAAVGRLDDQVDGLRSRLGEAAVQIERSVTSAEASMARVVDEVETAAGAALGRLAAARRRADELVAQGEREVAAALADVDEAMRAERDVTEGVRADTALALRRLEVEVADVLAQAHAEAQAEILAVSERTDSVLADLGALVTAPAGEASEDKGGEHADPEVAEVIDLRGPREARERAAEMPDPVGSRDALSEAIRRAVQRSLSG